MNINTTQHNTTQHNTTQHNTTLSSLIAKFFVILILFIVCDSYILSQTLPEIRYNGRYRQYRQDVDGTIKVQFAVYDNETAGNILWESQIINNVKVSSGIFSTTFSPQLTDKQWEKNLYLQVTIDDKKLSPREKLTYIPKSIYSCNGVPTGAILIWSGDANNLPEGWVLCDGTNGTPDLRDRFVIGAGNNYSINTTGGEEKVTLTVNNIPNHSHQISVKNYSENGQYTINDNRVGSPGTSYESSVIWNTNNNINEQTEFEPHNNMPPYYSLCYIMRNK